MRPHGGVTCRHWLQDRRGVGSWCSDATCRPEDRDGQGGRQVGILGWIILGLLAGAIAKAILPGDDPGGIIVTMIIGVVGALLGGFLAQAIFGNNTVDNFFDLSTWLTAIIGSIILLLLYRLVAGRRRV